MLIVSSFQWYTHFFIYCVIGHIKSYTQRKSCILGNLYFLFKEIQWKHYETFFTNIQTMETSKIDLISFYILGSNDPLLRICRRISLIMKFGLPYLKWRINITTKMGMVIPSNVMMFHWNVHNPRRRKKISRWITKYFRKKRQKRIALVLTYLDTEDV